MAWEFRFADLPAEWSRQHQMLRLPAHLPIPTESLPTAVSVAGKRDFQNPAVHEIRARHQYQDRQDTGINVPLHLQQIADEVIE
jgi:hypothetical protein